MVHKHSEVMMIIIIMVQTETTLLHFPHPLWFNNEMPLVYIPTHWLTALFLNLLYFRSSLGLCPGQLVSVTILTEGEEEEEEHKGECDYQTIIL